jgi:hypothetical protein
MQFFTLKSIKIRLFLTCWLIFALHFSTDFVREHYLVLSMVENFSFRLDKYVGLHHDIFETPDHGAHHNGNPGASMIAAIPYFVFKPVVNWIDAQYSSATRQRNKEGTAEYKDHRPPRVKFYKQVRERGWDIKFGLVSFITMVFCMAPLSALGAVVMFQALGRLRLSNRICLWMALLYAFGTPIFFRTAYLNQNFMVCIFGFIAFIQLWQWEQGSQVRIWRPFAFAGFLGGLALLCDYSGLVPLIMLYGYGLLRRMDSVPFSQALRESLWYFFGAIGPLLLLWFYQWRSFGHPFYPPQHYMPRVELSVIGYQGFASPNPELFWMLLFDYRFGLFVAAPVLMLAFCAPFVGFFRKNIIPNLETGFILVYFLFFSLFFSCVQYTRLEWVTGIRYMVPIIPFLFLLTVAVMVRIPGIAAYGLAVVAVAESWSYSMVRPVGVPEEGVINSIIIVFLEGFQLPWLTTLSKMASQYILPSLEGHSLSPLPWFALWAFIIYGIWRIKFPWKNLKHEIAHTDRRVSSPENCIIGDITNRL